MCAPQEEWGSCRAPCLLIIDGCLPIWCELLLDIAKGSWLHEYARDLNKASGKLHNNTMVYDKTEKQSQSHIRIYFFYIKHIHRGNLLLSNLSVILQAKAGHNIIDDLREQTTSLSLAETHIHSDLLRRSIIGRHLHVAKSRWLLMKTDCFWLETDCTPWDMSVLTEYKWTC